MRPRADEVLRSVIWTFETHIAPTIVDPYAGSLALTVSNLMRHVLLRMQLEGPALATDNAELRELLTCVQKCANGTDAASVELRSLPERLPARIDPAGFISLARLTDEAQSLRTLLDESLRLLQQVPEPVRSSPAYAGVREEIRSYLRHQLDRESTWIDPAFIHARR